MSDSPQFQYDNIKIDVFIIENRVEGYNEVDRDAFVEIKSACRLLSPLVTRPALTPAVLWSHTPVSQRILKNDKNYVHTFSLFRYLINYNMSDRSQPPQYYILKRLLRDLLAGCQNDEPAPIAIDPPAVTDESIRDLKSQLCSIQECLVSSQALYSDNSSTAVGGGSDANNQCFETIRDALNKLNSDLAVMHTNLLESLSSIKSMQHDVTNKIAFSNDTMIDNIKSIKDIILRNTKKHSQS
ncbi:p24 capsid protein [Leucania separata nucleopolyhedrovirus]|uniref:p24 capsid protein n=1 Tax=Leucania separata nucleopolyhedrovirus TaxID=1307956 RepID=Q0IKY0_NPVLS|nr:p24 capsid protein [Leucania separata nucleopolyhedrovirus]AAR28903.1 p24 capsid protein [Leucania separata nucleopolyhedrovirus]